LNDWLTAVTGELGEAANILKKVRRGDFGINQARPELADELADVVTYLDILASQCGIDLGQATITKFNRVSERVDSNVFIRADGSDFWIDADQ
jgi:NTP pyrophosphatase (non-canonical NTP hydrolase)